MQVEYSYLADNRVDKQQKPRLHFSFAVIGFCLRYNFFLEEICGGKSLWRPPLADTLGARWFGGCFSLPDEINTKGENLIKKNKNNFNVCFLINKQFKN